MKPINRRRLEQLIRGLRVRTGASVGGIESEVSRIKSEIELLEQSTATHLQTIEQLGQQEHDQSLTEWDEAIAQVWDRSERQTFDAIRKASTQQRQAKLQYSKDAEQTNLDAKKKAADLEQQFLRAKDVPIRALSQIRSSVQSLVQELQAVQQVAELVLAQRSFTAPAIPPLTLTEKPPTTAAEALQRLSNRVKAAKNDADQLANQPLAKLTQSIWWWLGCVGVFIIVVAGGVLSGLGTLSLSIAAGLVVAILSAIFSFLSIRPSLKRATYQDFPKVIENVQAGRHYAQVTEKLAVEENDQEIRRLAKIRDTKIENTAQWRTNRVEQLTHELNRYLDQVRNETNELKRSATVSLDHGLQEIDSNHSLRLQQMEQRRLASIASIHTNKSSSRDQLERLIRTKYLGGAERLRKGMERAVNRLSAANQWGNTTFPPWDQLTTRTSTSLDAPTIPLGSVDIAELFRDLQANGETSEFSAAEINPPVLYDPINDGCLRLIGEPKSAMCQAIVRSILLRLLTALPAGKLHLCVIDPTGLGQDFGWLMHLGDFEPTLVSHRVWTQTNHINAQLQSLTQAAEDLIQQSLRNRYSNIAEFNAEAGALAEPYRVIIWNDFPSGTDDTSLRHLRSLLDSGPRCGLIPILITPPNQSEAIDQLAIELGSSLTLAVDATQRVSLLRSGELQSLPFLPEVAPTTDQAQRIVCAVGQKSVELSRVEIPLEQVLPAVGQRQQADSSNYLDIPIGLSGVGRIQSLRLGIDTAQHAIIAGKTGSGKSTLLHAIITSGIMKYGPERLRVILLDFKKGVEFQLYADAKIPHADIIGIESQREFGLSTLQYIDECLQRRGEMFRKSGVQDLASWNARHPDQTIPRVLLLIDEFQELFVEDDKVSSAASLILDRIVRQGRSFGVHAILSSQTLAGAYTISRTTLGQIGVRIALQCDASDSQVIFADDNPAAARLKRPGLAIYNDAGGKVEGNHLVQVGWISKDKQHELFQTVDKGYRNSDSSTNTLGHTVVFDGNRPATFSKKQFSEAIQTAQSTINPDATWCVVGDSVAIAPSVAFPMTRQPGRNVLIVGANDAQASSVLSAIVASIPANDAKMNLADKDPAHFYVLQGAKPTDRYASQLPELWSQLGLSVTVGQSTQATDQLKTIYDELQTRITGGDPAKIASTIVLTVIQLGRIRDLKRDDEFSLGSYGDDKLTADKMLEEILRDGPSHGIHTVVWAENYSTVNRWLARNMLREFEVRILMQMSANDSTNLTDSVTASRLGENVMLQVDESTGIEEKFRPFAIDSLIDQLANDRPVKL